MALFESMLVLVLLAIALLQISRVLPVPYPTLLALAGVAVTAVPWAPDIAIDPQLALVLFIAPALLDAAYDIPPRVLWRNRLPLVALVAMAVVLTTLAVAAFGVLWAGLPLVAAVALGAIVAPPDAAAASAMLNQFPLAQRTVTVLKGESLLNDAVALLILGTAIGAASKTAHLSTLLPELALAVPGGILAGYGIGRVYLVLATRLAGTLGGTLFEFAATFAVWVLAERLHVSPILAVVAFAMTVARDMPERQSPRDRVRSYSVWEACVFLLNVLAFLLIGLQARAIILRLEQAAVWQALAFGGAVLVLVIAVRLAWVLAYHALVRLLARPGSGRDAGGFGQAAIIGWCGMRGVVTLAAALALPSDFPARDRIVLAALIVVLGTLVIQGLTLGPLLRWMRFAPDDSFDRQLAAARVALLDAAIARLEASDGKAAALLREDYRREREVAAGGEHPRAVIESDRLRRKAITAKRALLADMRRRGEIEDGVYHALEQELDWSELAASPPDRFRLVEG
ncbi:cation:proton antiporter [Azorhizobium doebereinerae]|uniref:cation:proton antiporter n=1 Tax=Azorhizobium doebereinerae TaxID=281091 RepID=UPI00041314F8|nr:sodium:proton antiporter [Azorhizobium doebereinerae]